MSHPVVIPWGGAMREIWIEAYRQDNKSIFDWATELNADFHAVDHEEYNFVLSFADPIDALAFKLKFGI